MPFVTVVLFYFSANIPTDYCTSPWRDSFTYWVMIVHCTINAHWSSKLIREKWPDFQSISLDETSWFPFLIIGARYSNRPVYSPRFDKPRSRLDFSPNKVQLLASICTQVRLHILCSWFVLAPVALAINLNFNLRNKFMREFFLIVINGQTKLVHIPGRDRLKDSSRGWRNTISLQLSSSRFI